MFDVLLTMYLSQYGYLLWHAVNVGEIHEKSVRPFNFATGAGFFPEDSD